MRSYVRARRALLEGNARESLDAAEQAVSTYIDPEGIYMALVAARLDEEHALVLLADSLKRGFSSFIALTRNAWLEPLPLKQRLQ